MTEAYPLHWPPTRPRTPPAKRRRGKFNKKEWQYREDGTRSWQASRDITVADGLGRLRAELDRIGAKLPVISSNIELRLDGWPRSDQRRMTDPGVTVYFQLAGKPHCMPCDTYDRVSDNLAAVAAHIEATRAIERHGVATLSEMFAGFLALPPPSDVRPWRQVFGFQTGHTVTAEAVEASFRVLARERHPDTGGSDAMMAELNAARAAARKELGT